MRYILSWNRFVCWLSMRGCVNFWVEANSFADWVCGDASPFEWKQIRFLIGIEGIRYLLRWRKFVCWLSMCGCVPFWVEADSFPDWDWGDSLPFEMKKIRLLIEYVWMRFILGRSRFVCWLSMWGCVPFWVEADSFPDWDWGDSLPFEMKKIRLLIEYVWMRFILGRSRFVCWLRLRICVTYLVDTVSFADWVCGDALTLRRSRFVCWFSMRGFVTFWDEENSFADWVCGDAFPFE